MKSFTAILALAGAVSAVALPQAVTSAIAPEATSGCSTSYGSTFEISVVNVTASSTKRSTALTCTLKDGVLTDAQGRIGYIASNEQFQFDGPPQAGAIYTSGWSVCSNNTLALGDSAIFYECLSGTFYNLYDESTGDQCSEVYINVIAVSGSSSTTSGVQTEIADGQVTGSAVTSAAPVTQLTDGQLQATTATPVVSQISDGQIQATTATAAVVSQISDGQIQATTAAAVVSQISDGQIQATTAAAVVSQISDGQIQATTGVAVVSQISDGQIQATANGTTVAAATATASTPAVFTGAASGLRAELFALAAGVLAVAVL